MADDFIKHFQSMSLKDVKRELIGSYCWVNHSEICIPGFPSKLKPNYKTLNVGYLDDKEPAQLEDAHPNQAFHTVYFEPLEQVLQYHKPKMNITSFDLVTDRNNLRKINAALEDNQERYADFEIYARKIGKTLVLRRKGDNTPLGTRIGKQYESKLCNHSEMMSCHMIVKVEFNDEDNNPVSVLIRCEIDAVVPKASTLSIKDYKLETTTEDNLKVYRPSRSSFPELQLEDIRELTLSATLKWGNMFQSAVVGVPAIVHGVKFRKETRVESTPESEKDFKEAVKAVLEFGAQIQEGKTYKIFRKSGGSMDLEEVKDDRKWFAAVDA